MSLGSTETQSFPISIKPFMQPAPKLILSPLFKFKRRMQSIQLEWVLLMHCIWLLFATHRVNTCFKTMQWPNNQLHHLQSIAHSSTNIGKASHVKVYRVTSASALWRATKVISSTTKQSSRCSKTTQVLAHGVRSYSSEAMLVLMGRSLWRCL